METVGDAMIAMEAVGQGQGPMGALYRAQWEEPKPERGHPWRARAATALASLARSLAPQAMEQQPTTRRITDGAAP